MTTQAGGETQMSFTQWLDVLRREMMQKGFSAKAIQSIDIKAWRTFYDAGYTPLDALIEDISVGAE